MINQYKNNMDETCIFDYMYLLNYICHVYIYSTKIHFEFYGNYILLSTFLLYSWLIAKTLIMLEEDK